MRFARVLALGAAVLVAVAACSSGGGSSSNPSGGGSSSNPEVKIGSDGFYESKLVAELFAQVPEASAYTVDRTLGMGARQVRHPLLEKDDIDLPPEYVGSGLGYYDKS